MKELVRAFSAKSGIQTEVDYGGSGMLISRLRLAQRGDLFIPGDLWSVELAEKEGLVASRTPVCWLVPVILVPKGNPAKVRSLQDLARPGLRLGLGNPKSCQVGRASEELIAKNGLDAAAIQKNVVFSSTTVNELGLQVKTGSLDATIVWDAVAAQYADSAEVISIPASQNVPSRVAVAVLKSSGQPEAAQEFVKFLLTDAGQAILRAQHYRTEPPQ
jgi:molybdate transport system substrate-binding protein